MDRSFVEENRAALDRLRAFVERVTATEFEQPMEVGWTVASVLGHMALWDLRVVAQLDLWGADGSGTPPRYDEDAVDWINDATKPLISALEPRVAARIAVETAEAADRRVAAMSDELFATNEASGLPINPQRVEHRLEHLDEVEQALSRAYVPERTPGAS